MNEQFTLEEVNLMCIYNTSNRDTLITALNDGSQDYDEPDMAEIAKSALAKLMAMSDLEFAAIDLFPEYGDYDERED